MIDLILKDEVFAIIGAAIEVQRVLGSGFLEPVYQEALEIESRSRALPFVPQKILRIDYKGCLLKKEYIADLVYYDQIIAELKALDKLTGREESQILNYLKATKMKVGLLINFWKFAKVRMETFCALIHS